MSKVQFCPFLVINEANPFVTLTKAKLIKYITLVLLKTLFFPFCVYTVWREAGWRGGSGRSWGQTGRIAWELNSGPLKDLEDSKHAGISLAPQKAFQCVPLFPKNQDQSTVLYDLWRDVAHEKR